MSTQARMRQRIERFDHFRTALTYWHGRATIHARRYKNCLRNLRRDAFEIGSLIVRAQKDWHNELLDLAKQDGFKKLDEWIDDRLAVVDLLHENRASFLANIASGMSLKQYLTKGGLWGISPQPEKREAATEAVATKPSNTKAMTNDELIGYYRNVIAAMRGELLELRTENKQLRREVQILERFRKQLAKVD